MKRILIVGMHRSGTSALAGELHNYGVAPVLNLIEGDRGNPLGYYEPKEIIDLNNEFLKARGLGYFFSVRQIRGVNFELNNSERQALKIKLNSKKVPANVYLKEPRISLFIQAYLELFKPTHIIFLYRGVFEVMDSLVRRGTDSIITRNPSLGLQSWIVYNEQILKYIENNNESNKFILLNSNQLRSEEGLNVCFKYLGLKFNKMKHIRPSELKKDNARELPVRQILTNLPYSLKAIRIMHRLRKHQVMLK